MVSNLTNDQVHEMAMVSAVQEAQKDNLRSFNDYMLKVLEVSMKELICRMLYWVFMKPRSLVNSKSLGCLVLLD